LHVRLGHFLEVLGQLPCLDSWRRSLRGVTPEVSMRPNETKTLDLTVHLSYFCGLGNLVVVGTAKTGEHGSICAC